MVAPWPPEILYTIFEILNDIPSLFCCALVCKHWTPGALMFLYRGSWTNMHLRSPSIDWWNHLFIASPKRFGFKIGYVKHLLLLPDEPGLETTVLNHYYVCYQKLLALRRRERAKLMFSSLAAYLYSITIPLEIMDEDFEHAADLLLQTTIQFLAIDISYCQLLVGYLLGRWDQCFPLKLFENLRALAIYYPENDEGINDLCDLMAKCRLKFFHLEHQRITTAVATGAIPKKLLLSLQQQTELEVLALKGMHCNVFETPNNSNPANLDDETAWPKLKGLYLRTCSLVYLKQLVKFKDIQVIALQEAERNVRHVTPEVAGYIAMCDGLRALHLRQYGFRGAELVSIARGCRQLRYLCVSNILDAAKSTFVEDTFLPMIQALGHLEVLRIRSKFRIDGAVLAKISELCRRLTLLELPLVRLDLSRPALRCITPLSCLRGMVLSAIWFEHPKHLLQTDMLKSLAGEWRKAFPTLAMVPCSEDTYGWEARAGHDEDTSDGDMVYKKPELDFDDGGSSWFLLRVELWRRLGYRRDSSFENMKNIWKRQFELETFGWPVVPFQAFIFPDLHATATSTEKAK